MKITNNLKISLLISFIGLIITILYFKPLVFDSKELVMHDVKQASYAYKELQDFRESTGKEVLWTDRVFGGMPLYVTGVQFPSDWAYQISYKLRFLPRTADVTFLSFLGAFVLLLCLRINPIIAGIGAFAYGFNTYSIVCTQAGHIFKILAIAYTPLILGAMALVFRKKYLLGLALATLGITLSLASKHYQIVYYFMFFGAIYFIYESIKMMLAKEIKHLIISCSIFMAAIGIGVGPHISTLWCTFEYQQFSTRGQKELTPLPEPKSVDEASDVVAKNASKNLKPSEGLEKEYAFAWSEGKWESLTLLIPHLYGGSSQEGYWGDQPGTAGPVYAGSILFFLFFLYLVNIQNIKKYWVLAAGVLLLMISWGRNFELLNYPMFDYFPMFNKFRSVSMAIVFTILAMAIGAGFGLDYFLKQEKEAQLKTLKIACMSFFPFVIFVYIATKSFANMNFNPGYPADQMSYVIDMRKNMIFDSMMKVFILNALAAGILLFITTKKIIPNFGLGLIGALLIFDLVSIDTNYLNHDSFEFPEENVGLQPTEANLKIMQDKGHYRVLDMNNPFNNSEASYFHNSIGGYDAAKMQRYQDLIERQISTGNYKVLSMLNTKYVIDNNGQVQKTNFEAGAAWFVSAIKKVKSADQEMAYLADSTFDPKTNAVIDQSKFNISDKNQSVGTIKLDKYLPNHLTYNSQNNGAGLAVFSEIYYNKGWNAYIDGKLSPYVRADYVLRALEIPAGKHTIEFKFEPKSFYLGEKISLVFSILLVLILIAGFGWELKNHFTKPALLK